MCHVGFVLQVVLAVAQVVPGQLPDLQPLRSGSLAVVAQAQGMQQLGAGMGGYLRLVATNRVMVQVGEVGCDQTQRCQSVCCSGCGCAGQSGRIDTSACAVSNA